MSQRLKAIELFLAVGLAVGVSACGGETASNVDTETAPENSAEVSEGGEGGEGGEYSEGEQANADFKDKLSGAQLLSALKEGGHVIYFRHAQTEKDYADQADPDMRLDDCDTQRKLNDVGKKQAEDIGAAFTEKEIPVGKVIASEYCRAWQTAELAFGSYDEKNPKLNFLPFEDYTDEQVEEMKANVTPLLTEVPEDGENTVIVGHDDIFEAATGIYPDPQGIAYVLTPDGEGNFELVANMLPDEWADL
ncbi:MAG: histidine phosphatase family protein [Symploca sp. SIO2D2]|nr:histidine phosphatase family protein [Symploca sp. SIO2D2]